MIAKPAITRLDRCAICDGSLAPLINLPALPLTDTYCQDTPSQPLPGIDQQLLFCSTCSHGQLQSVIAPEYLYGQDYGFRTSASATARKGTEFFLQLLADVAGGRRFDAALDLGCNDLYLLEQLQSRARQRLGIDPVWRGREHECAHEDIQVLGLGIEEVDLAGLPQAPDLIVCRHALEHIANPAKVLQDLVTHAAPGALLVFEVPGLDTLLQRYRFDQVFHQHLNYFSLQSFLQLLDRVGCRYLTHRVNEQDWGALAIAFEVGRAPRIAVAKTWSEAEVAMRYQLFQQQTRNVGRMLESFADSPCYGYGAAQMLPVIAYHLGTDLSQLRAVLDDDATKQGWGYRNLPVRIASPSSVGNWRDTTLLITAPDNARPIMHKCLTLAPKNLLNIFNIF